MLGALITFAVCASLAFLGARALRSFELDPAARAGLGGLIALGALGTITLFIALLPGALSKLAYVVALLPVIGAVAVAARGKRLGIPRPTPVDWPFVAVLTLCGILGLLGVLAPATALEWDSLAYHLAVPKLWLEAGRAFYIPFIHHSNFPLIVDDLYLWGLQWGGQPGAKAFVFSAAALGALAIFGLARQVYGRNAGWWAALAFATAPVVLWLSGTAYIDVPNGLYAGLGIVLAGLYCKEQKREYLWLAAVMLGFAAASKYTGLQTIFAVGVTLFAAGIKRRQAGKYFASAASMAVLALALASPWYIKNVLWTGNPVYPFFYSKLGGQNWSEERAAVYSNEQQSFGVGRTEGRRDVKQLGHAVLGLAYQPGRYINPAQEHGAGLPIGAVGAAVLCAMTVWALSGKARSFELAALAAVGISLAMWFFLSQQSRYIIALAVPLSILLGGGVLRLKFGRALSWVAAAQAAYSIALVYGMVTRTQTKYDFGAESAEEYQSRRISFYDPSKAINERVPKTGKVALYDELFGYLLDVPYFWANPGHSSVIPYESMKNGRDYADAMRKLGFTHVYISITVLPPADSKEWLDAMGLAGPAIPMAPQRKAWYMGSFEKRYVPLVAEASAIGEMRPIWGNHTGILFLLRPTGR